MIREFFKLLPVLFLMLVYPIVFFYFSGDFFSTILFMVGYFILAFASALAFVEMKDLVPRKVSSSQKNIFFNDIKVVDMPLEAPIPPIVSDSIVEKRIVYEENPVVEPKIDGYPQGFKGYCFNCKKVVPVNDAVVEDKVGPRGVRTWIKNSTCRFCGHSVRGLLARGD